MVLDEAEAHVRVPAKIAIDFLKISRSMRSRSFSARKRAISEAWSAGIGAACVVGRRVALDTRGSSDDGHWACNGFTASTVPATGLRARGFSSSRLRS